MVSLLLIITLISKGQTLSLNLDSLDRANPEDIEIVYDINGDTCSLVIVNTLFDSLKFFTNRGVEKIEKGNKKYRVWISRESTKLKISVPKFPLFEYILPKSDYKNSVYIFNLSGELNQKVITKDKYGTKPILFLDSKPSNVKVNIEGREEVRTPVKLTLDYNVKYNFQVKKAGYKHYNDTYMCKEGINNLEIELEELNTKDSRFFIMPSFTLSTDQNDLTSNMFGASIGFIGKTGFYASFKYRKPKIYSTGRGNDKEEFLTSNKRIGIGLTQQLGKPSFFSVGCGYYETESIGQNGLDQEDFFHKGLTVDLGLIFRINWNFLVSINTGMKFYSNEGSLKFEDIDFSLGIGYNFNKKSQNK